MDKIAKKIVSTLLDKYERSKSFQEKNKIKQSFYIEPAKMFSKYADDAEYEFFSDVNESVDELQRKGFVNVQREKNNVINKVTLKAEQVEEIYLYLNRTSKREENEWLKNAWNQMLSEMKTVKHLETDNYVIVLKKYIEEQKKRMKEGKTIVYFESNRDEYIDLLKAVKQVVRNQQEIYIRDFSIQVFSDSKRVEKLKSKIQSFLFEYGDFEEKECILEECGIVNTPTYVAMKGNAILKIAKQTIDLSLFKGDIALSTESMKELTSLKIQAERVITIENMTSFHDYSSEHDFVIYLGGFHNKVKRELLLSILIQNPEKKYYHFGDIDAGGFYIFEHLCKKTEMKFRTLHMNIYTLNKYKEHWIPLTKNDKNRIKKLIEQLDKKEEKGIEFVDYRDVLWFMLQNNCKLEQEVLKNTS